MSRPKAKPGTHGEIWYEGSRGRYTALTKLHLLDGATVRLKRAGATKGAAKQALEQAIAERLAHTAGLPGSPITGGSTFAQAAEVYFTQAYAQAELPNSTAKPSLSSLANYRSLYRTQLLPTIGQLPLCEVNVPVLNAVVVKVRKARSKSSAQTCRSIVSNVMQLGLLCGAITHNPARDIRIPSDDKPAPRALSTAQLTAWFAALARDPAAVRADLLDLSLFMVGAGTRIGEALAVSWEEIDLEAGTVLIAWTMNRITGRDRLKGARRRGDKARLVTLPPFALEMLRRRRRAYAASMLTGGRWVPTDKQVFPTSHGTWRNVSNTCKDYREFGQRAGLELTSHIFRKTVATAIDAQGQALGLTVRDAADQLGHASISMTLNHYMDRPEVVNPNTALAVEAALGPALRAARGTA